MEEEGFTESTFKSSRGDDLYYREYLPAEPKAFFVYHHGYGAHCALMHKEYLYLKQAGIASLVYDAVTAGRSEMDPSKRMWVKGMLWLPNDVEAFYQEVVSARQPASGKKLPCFLGGQSMGGMVSIMVGILQPSHWTGLVLTSPAVDTEKDFALRTLAVLAPVLVRIIPGVRLIPAIPVEAVSAKPAVQERLMNDPLMDTGNIRVQFGKMFVDSWRWIAQNEHKLALPLWIAYDPEDKVVYPPAIQRLQKNCASKDVTVHLTSGYQHEPLLSQEKDEVIEEVAKWILAHS